MVYQISSESPEICRICYKKHFGLFSEHTVYTFEVGHFVSV